MILKFSIFEQSDKCLKILIYLALNASFFSKKFTKFSGGWGSAPDPSEGTYNVPRLARDFVTPFWFS